MQISALNLIMAAQQARTEAGIAAAKLAKSSSPSEQFMPPTFRTDTSVPDEAPAPPKASGDASRRPGSQLDIRV